MDDLLARLATLPELRAAAEVQAGRDLAVFYDVQSDAVVEFATPVATVLRRQVDATFARLLDPTNPAAEGVLADLYRWMTGRESAHVGADSVTADYHVLNWQIVHLDPAVGMARMPAWVDIDGTQAPTRYEAWARAILAHYDTLAARKDGTGF